MNILWRVMRVPKMQQARVGESHADSSEDLGSIAGLVRSSDSDVGGCRCPAARDGRRGENDVFRPLRGIASGFVRARLISCGECELAGLSAMPVWLALTAIADL